MSSKPSSRRHQRPVRRYKLTREAYERMAESGVFPPDARIELIHGQLVEMTPQKSRHAAVVALAHNALSRAVPAGHYLRSQLPLILSEHDVPEPDFAVVEGQPRDHLKSHPGEAVLIVEVSDTSLEFDRRRKQGLYSRRGIPTYIIVNLQEDVVELYADPSGDTYRTKRTFESGETLSLAAPFTAEIAVADLLP